MYQIIYFDLDDTLIDFAGSEKKSLMILHAQFYKAIPYSEFELLFKDINSNLWKRVGAKEDALKPGQVRTMRFEQLNQKLKCDIPLTLIADEYERYLGENAEWFPQVKNVIEFLHQKGHILGIVTNGLISVQDKKYERLELSKWFDCFTVSDRVGVAKPNKEIFSSALNEIAIKRNKNVDFFSGHSMLMVGDSIPSDGHGAKSFGIDFCLINGGNIETKHSEATITYQIKSVADLPSCIGYKEEYDFFLKMKQAQIKKYMDCVGLKGFAPKIDVDSLSILVVHHLLTFTYQNIYLFSECLKEPQDRIVPSLDFNTLFKQMVVNKKGGFCFQNAELLAHVLGELGFKVERRVAKVINTFTDDMNQSDENNKMTSHELLIVEIDNKKYLIDTAFGSNSLRKPIPFVTGQHVIQNDVYKLTPVSGNKDSDTRLEVQIDNKWFALLQISAIPYSSEAIAKVNEELFLTNRDVPVRNMVYLGKVTHDERKFLVLTFQKGGNFFKSHSANKTKDHALHSFSEAKQLAQEEFDVNLLSKL